MPSWDRIISARTFQKAGTKLRQKYKQEYLEMVKESGNEAQAQARLQREHREEFRVIFNEVALLTGHHTAEMRRAKMIERREQELQRLKEGTPHA
jgi:hypothetical protein